MAPWHDAAKRNSTTQMAQLIATNRGTMLHAWNRSVCATCHSRSPDNGRHWGCCHRKQCANYGSKWNGNTALHDAAAAGHVEVATLLLECGADANATNKHAQTPLDLVRGEAVAALLRAKGGILGADGSYAPRCRLSQESAPPRSAVNPSTLSGAIDVLAVRQADGTLRSTPLHVRFGKLLVPFPAGLIAQVHVNLRMTAISLQLGSEGNASYTPSATELAGLELRVGPNTIEYRCGGRPVVATVYLLERWERLVISDVDGTITRSDLRGHLPRAIARLANVDQFHAAVPALFSRLAANGYLLLYLSARPIGFAAPTLELLASALDGGHRLPRGPLLLSPSRTLESLDREIVRKVPHEFKIQVLSELRALWPHNHQPFARGFGNKPIDTEAYRAVGVPPDRLFHVDPQSRLTQLQPEHSTREAVQPSVASYGELLHHVDHFFPHAQPTAQTLEALVSPPNPGLLPAPLPAKARASPRDDDAMADTRTVPAELLNLG